MLGDAEAIRQDSRIRLLFLGHSTNTEVLERQMGGRYRVSAHQTLPDEACIAQMQLCIIDGPRLLAHHAWFRAYRARTQAMTLPILLLTTQENTFWREQNFADIIDESVLMPTDPRVLQARVKAILRVQQLHRDNAQLSASRAAHVEALLREREVRSRFVAAISHDLRVPLTSMQLAAEMLLRGATLTAKQQKYTERILKGAERLDGMIHHILDANQLRQDQNSPLHLGAGDLGQMLNIAMQEWRTQYPSRFSDNSPYKTIIGCWDMHAIRRALDNLITNALKYGAAASSIDVDIAIASETDEKKATLSVVNFGESIPEHEQNRLFELFHRTPSAVAGNQKGWGIGLAVVRDIAHAHGGEVGVESSQKAGTKFYFTVHSQKSPTCGT